jgi:hypothetical protein
VIAIASGVATNAISDSLRVIVARARDRGKVQETGPGNEGDKPSGSDGGPDDI